MRPGGERRPYMVGRLCPYKIAGIELGERAVHFQDGVYRALDDAGHVSRDVSDVLQVLVVDVWLALRLLDGDEFALRHERPFDSAQGRRLRICL